MDVFEAIKTRRSIRKFRPLPVQVDKVVKAIYAATYAPSAGNLQPWRFIIIDDPSIHESLYELCYNQDWIKLAPIVVAVVADVQRCSNQYGKKGRDYAIQSVSAAIQNLLLALHAQGLGAVWVGAFKEEVNELLGVPNGMEVIAFISVGVPDEKPEPKTFFDPKSRIFFNKYGLRIKNLASLLKDYTSAREKNIGIIKKFINIISNKFSKGKRKIDQYGKELIEIEDKSRREKVMKLGLKREPGWLYFIDEEGDISRVPTKRKREELQQELKNRKENKEECEEER